MKIEFELKSCGACAHCGHSGSFTPGGLKRICAYDGITEYMLKHNPNLLRQDATGVARMGTNTNEDGAQPGLMKFAWYWGNRVLTKYIENKTFPVWCPLKNGGRY